MVAPDAGVMAERIAGTLLRWPWLVWCDEAGSVQGYAYAGAHADRLAYQWSVNVSVYVDGRCHRRGVGRALYGVLLEVLARQGVVTALAGITMPNAGSEGLHRALGFVPAALFPRVGYKFGAWHDVAWLTRQVPAALPAGEPPPPRPLPELLAGGALADLRLA
jgi:phosphinothricin acetyltransferase